MIRHGWRRSVAGGHRHLFALHRHPDWPCHPRPGRWHAHLWWFHRHSVDELVARVHELRPGRGRR